MLAIREIWGNFRDDSGHQHFGSQALAGELGVVQQVLEYGQANDSLGKFDPIRSLIHGHGRQATSPLHLTNVALPSLKSTPSNRART